MPPRLTARLRAAAFFLLLGVPVLSHALTALWYEREAGAYGGGPSTRLYQAPTDTFALVAATSGYLTVRVNYPNSEYVFLDLAPPTGGTFTVNTAYEEAARTAFRGNAPGIDMTSSGSGCNTITGRFSVLELTFDSESKIASFAANFEQHCDGQGPATYGELRINSSVPLTMSKPAGSLVPDPFAFASRPALPPSTTVVSNSTTVYGINGQTPISVTGGEYSVNGGTFTTQPGLVVNRDHVRVRAMSPATPTTRTATLSVGGKSAPFSLTTYGQGQPLTAFYQRSFPGDFVGGGELLDWRAPDLAMSVSGPSSTGLTFSLVYGSRRKTVELAAALHQLLTPGGHEQAARAAFRGTSPGLDFYGDGRGCNTIIGRFSVLEAEYAQDGTVLRFAVDFEQWCDGSTAPAFGELRYNSTIPLSTLMPAGDSSPDAFALVAQSPVKAGSIVYSNWIRIYGVNAPVPISITGGQYSLNGGDFTSQPGTAGELDDIVVRVFAAGTPGATAQATLNAGGQIATLSATTWQPGTKLTGLYYRSTSGDYIGQGATRMWLAPRNEIGEMPYAQGRQFTLNGTGGMSMNLLLNPTTGGQLVAGTYEGAARFATASAPGLDFFGDGRGCNASTGRFVIHEAVYNGAALSAFAADFEQHCDGGPPLFGEIRINSSVPFSALQGVACSPGDTDGDGVPDCVELAEFLDPATKDNDVFADPRLFAMQQYRDFFNREGDDGGIGFWSGQVAGGAMSRGQVIESFLGSLEFQGSVAPVVRLYSAFFLRLPEYQGLSFWIGFQRQGNSLATISQYFAQSQEFQDRYGSLDNGQFVDLVYQNVLERAPDAGGRAFWKGRLDQGVSRGEVMLGFSESDEYRQVTANEVYVTMAYLGMLHRAPDPGGFAFWTGYLDDGNSGLALIDGFLSSQEYRGRFLP